MIIEIIPCLSDNYSYLIHEKKLNTVSIVDPSEFKTCDEAIKKYPLNLVILKKLLTLRSLLDL